jgi:hypothetical protein
MGRSRSPPRRVSPGCTLFIGAGFTISKSKRKDGTGLTRVLPAHPATLADGHLCSDDCKDEIEFLTLSLEQVVKAVRWWLRRRGVDLRFVGIGSLTHVDTVFDRWQGQVGVHFDIQRYLVTVTIDKREHVTKSTFDRFMEWATVAFGARCERTSGPNHMLVALRCDGRVSVR